MKKIIKISLVLLLSFVGFIAVSIPIIKQKDCQVACKIERTATFNRINNFLIKHAPRDEQGYPKPYALSKAVNGLLKVQWIREIVFPPPWKGAHDVVRAGTGITGEDTFYELAVYSYLYDKDGFLSKIIIGFHIFEYRDDPAFGTIEDGYILQSELTPEEMALVMQDETNLKEIAEKYAVTHIKKGKELIVAKKIKEEEILQKVTGDAGNINNQIDKQKIEDELKK